VVEGRETRRGGEAVEARRVSEAVEGSEGRRGGEAGR